MKAISKINNTLAKIEGAVMVFWFAIVLVVMTCQVVSRYIFNAPIAWSEEFARYSFVWISYIGCAYCVSVDAHTGITAFRDALPPKAKKLTTVLGNVVVRLYDVGVAGIHRLLAHADDIASAQVVVAVAGMEGALASVVGGLASCPVIAVPTSVGYGASFGGVAALLAMLNSCASGVSVVNIDNGFGAGYQASAINHLKAK